MLNPLKKYQERERAMAEELRAIVGDYEKKLGVEQSKVIELEGVIEIAMDTLQHGKKVQLESEAGAYLGGLGGEFDTFRLTNVDRIENVKNAWHRYLRRHGRDPEALRPEDLEKMIERHPELRDTATMQQARPTTHRYEGGSITG